jgi:hypothetical protein
LGLGHVRGKIVIAKRRYDCGVQKQLPLRNPRG